MKKIINFIFFLISFASAQNYLITDSLNKSIFFGDRYPLVLDTVNVNVGNLKDSVIVKNFPSSQNVVVTNDLNVTVLDTAKVYTYKKQASTASQDSANISTGINNVKQLVRTAVKSKGYFICNNTNRALFFSFNTKGSFLILQPQANYFVSEEFTTLPLYATTTSARTRRHGSTSRATSG